MKIVTAILGGGAGSRLAPLTEVRCKPAVPIGGKYRLIDLPISNSLNSGYRRIFVLTQFNSDSLIEHISATYRFDIFGQGGVHILAAQQTMTSADWYQGTADAIRQNLPRLLSRDPDLVLILSGDHLYRMDYRSMVQHHLVHGNDITVGAVPVTPEEASGFGVIKLGSSGRIEKFVEKPKSREELEASGAMLRDGAVLGSMGIYVFRPRVLEEILRRTDANDFGGDVLPSSLDSFRVGSYRFEGYWKDVGTIEAFFNANLELTGPEPPFRFHEPGWPIFTRPRFLSASRLKGAQLNDVLLSDGAFLGKTNLERVVVGHRMQVGSGTDITDAVLMGADYYRDGIGIGRGVTLRRVIVDKNASIGDECVILGDPNRPDEDAETHVVRNGIVVVRRGAQVPPGTRI